MKKVYLDYAAATPIDERVLQAMLPYFSQKFYNPSATYLSARAIRQELAEFRATVAKILGAKPAEIVFTSGATEANNLAIRGIAAKFPEAKILASSLEHSSVLEPAAAVGARLIPALPSGLINFDKLQGLIDDNTVLVSVMMVNNELGSLQPLREIARIINEHKTRRLSSGNELPLYFHTDAAQATNYFDLQTSRLGVDLMSINGGKMYGPKGSGFLFVKAGTRLDPQILGGSQEFGVRSGTESMHQIAGLAVALAQAQERADEQAVQVGKLRQELETGILDMLPTAVINGGKHRAPHISSVTFAGVDNETLMMQLDERGIECALGSACSASSEEPSAVLKAISLSDDLARSTIRFSLGRLTSRADIDQTLEAIRSLLSVEKSA
jgi:cysteine desulfurase